jgi:hypothetical protein
MGQDALSETYLKSKRYLVFFAAILLLTAVVGLTPAQESQVLGWSIAKPDDTRFVVFIVVLYYWLQLALFWDVQGEQLRKLAQHSTDFAISCLIAAGALVALPIILLLEEYAPAWLGRETPVRHNDLFVLALLLAPPVGLVLYRRVFRPSLAKSRRETIQRERTILDVLTAQRWRLVFNPVAYAQTKAARGSKLITFRANGSIGEGRNNNEASWRLNSGYLEVLDDQGRVFSRFVYDPASDRLVHTNDQDTQSIRDQYMINEGAIEDHVLESASG